MTVEDPAYPSDEDSSLLWGIRTEHFSGIVVGREEATRKLLLSFDEMGPSEGPHWQFFRRGSLLHLSGGFEFM